MNEPLPALQVLLEGSLERVHEVARVLADSGVASQMLPPSKENKG